MKTKFTIAVILLILLMPFRSDAQDVALKTNLLYDATLTVNIGGEIAVAPRWSVDPSGNFNGWTLDDARRWKHWLVQPELRYWLCSAMGGHFFGIHALGGQYNVGHIHNSVKFLGTDFSGLTDQRYQGWAVGAGIAYGYSWMLGKHWNVEAEIGIGYAYTKFDVYECAGCGKKTQTDRHHNYFGPTKAAVNIIYVF